MKTYNQFLNTPFSEEVKPPEPQGDDPTIKSKEKKQKQIKKMVLLKKLQAVRAGAGADIVASYEPEGEVLDELKTSTLRNYVNKASIDAVGRGVDAGIKGMTGPKKEMEKNMTKAYKRMRGINTAANKLASRAERKEEVELDERLGGKGYKSYTDLRGKKISGDWEDSDRGAGNKAKKRAGGKVEKKSPTYRAHVLNKEEVIVEKDLNAAERRALPNKDFALPGKGKGPEGKQAGSYPIPDEKHARSALSLVAQHGTPEEKATVRAKVKKKFPNIEVNEGVMKMVKKVMS